MATKENTLYTPLIKGAKRHGIVLCRIKDSTMTGKKPFDMFGIMLNGKAICVEVKVVQSFTLKFPWNLFEPHQVDWLQVYQHRTGIAIAAIYNDGNKTMYLFFPHRDQFTVDTLTDDIHCIQLKKVNNVWVGWNL